VVQPPVVVVGPLTFIILIIPFNLLHEGYKHFNNVTLPGLRKVKPCEVTLKVELGGLPRQDYEI